MSSIIKSSRLKLRKDEPFVIASGMENFIAHDDEMIYDDSSYDNVNSQEELVSEKDKEILSLTNQINDLKFEIEALNKLKEEKLLEIEKMTAEAMEELKQKEKNVFEKAQSEGYQEGINNSEVEISNMKLSLQNEFDAKKIELENEKSEFKLTMKQSIKNIVNLAITSIVENELSSSTKLLDKIIKNGLEEVSDEKSVRVILSEEDYKIFDKEMFLKKIDTELIINFSTDKKLNKGACLIETSCGFIDASVDNLLIQIKNIIEEKIN